MITETEALEVLRQVRLKLGRKYKSLIREAWMNGNYDSLGLAEWASQLQRTRNAHGPTWLVRARL